MVNTALVYQTRFQKTLHEASVHLARIDEWFVLREIRNDITHDYEDNRDQARHILNNIYQYLGELRQILVEIEQKRAITDK